MSDTTASAEPIGKYIFMAALGFLAWTVGDALIRYLNSYPVHLVAFVGTGATAFLLCAISPKLGGVKSAISLPKLKLRVLRGAILALAGMLGFVTFAHLELTTAYSILFFAPIIAKITSFILVKESISLKAWLISILGFIGVLIILRPGIIPMEIGTISALTQVFLFSLGHVMGRYIGQENQSLFSLAIFQYIFIALGTAYPAYISFSGISPVDLILMLSLGVTSTIGGVAVSYAFASAPAAYIAPIHYTQIVWGLIWGALLFNEYPDKFVIIGASLIILSGLLLIKNSRSKAAIPKRRTV